MTNSKHPETLALHAGWRADETTGSVAVPIHQTTSYQFKNTDQAANLFSLSELGNIYTRIMNPTNDILEKRVASLEGGVAALAVSSGQTASAFAIQNLAKAGDNIVSSTDLYGGTWNLFANTLKDMGIEVRFVDPENPSAFEEATDDRTRAYYAETLPNPKLKVFPISEVSAIGKKYGIPLIVDNTAAPIICKPIEHGAAIVVYSLTKYIGGHGNSVGGMIVDGGNFDWEGAGKDRQPALNTPDPFLILQGLETLSLRMKSHCDNASKVANFLQKHKSIKKVIYPELQSGNSKASADKHLHGGYGGLVGFELSGGLQAGKNFIDALELFYHVANIGDSRSLAIHPATTTHSQLSAEEQFKTGVSEDYVRLSIGIEHIDDILADLTKALDKSEIS